MPVNVYECMFLLDTTKLAGDVTAASKVLQGTLEKHGAEILASRPWDERRLLYPVKGHKKGLYYLMYFRLEGRKLVEVERDLALNETVLRNLFIRIDEKLVESMLAVARDEHALALQAVPEGSDDDYGGGHDAPRRGRREESVKD